MSKATGLMELGYKSGSWQPADSTERKPRFTKPVQIFQNEEGKVWAKVDTRSLAPGVVMLMTMAADKERPFEMEDDCFMSVFGPRDGDPEELVYSICYVAGRKPDPDNAGQTKPVWGNFAKVWKRGKGKHYGKVEALALNPIVLMQMRKQKEDLGREVFFAAFMEKPAAGSAGADKPPGDEDDEIPF